MNIIIDGTIYSSAPSGGAFRYFNELIPRLSRFPNTEVNIFTPKNSVPPPVTANIKVTIDSLPNGNWLPNGRLKSILRLAKKNIQGYILKSKFSGRKDSIYHSTYYTSSPWPEIPQVVTVYDMISELFSETYELPHHQALRKIKTECLKKASRVVAISNQTKTDLQNIYQIPASSIDVIYHGVDHSFFSQVQSTEIKTNILKNRRLLSPYFLFLGGRLHHKNFIRFLRAFSMSQVSKDYILAVAGTPWSHDELQLIKSLGLEKKIVLMPYLSDTELPTIYQNAAAFAFPSYYEGFGLPLIEAMAAGCPVVASNGGPFPELSQGAALLFDPFDEDKMGRSLEDILVPATRATLIEAGKKQAGKFSWNLTAEQYYDVYKKTLKGQRRN